MCSESMMALLTPICIGTRLDPHLSLMPVMVIPNDPAPLHGL